MGGPIECLFCGTPLDPAQEFTLWVELQNEDDPAYLDVIRRLPHAAGEPLVICRVCQAGVEANQRRLAFDEAREQQIDRRIRGLTIGCLVVAVSFPFVLAVIEAIVNR